MPYGIIYALASPSGKLYIGQTTCTLRERVANHGKQARAAGADTKISRAIRKYGIENFAVAVIAECKTQTELDRAEQLHIRKSDSIASGYNLQAGGANGKHSPETRKKISASAKGQTPWSKGKTLSATHKKRLSESLKGRPPSNKGKPDE